MLSPSRRRRMHAAGAFPRCRWITLADGTRQFWCGGTIIWHPPLPSGSTFPRCEWVNVSSNNRYFHCGGTVVWNGPINAQPPRGLIAGAVREYETTGRISNPPAPCRWVTLANGTRAYKCGGREILGVGGPLQTRRNRFGI